MCGAGSEIAGVQQAFSRLPVTAVLRKLQIIRPERDSKRKKPWSRHARCPEESLGGVSFLVETAAVCTGLCAAERSTRCSFQI